MGDMVLTKVLPCSAIDTGILSVSNRYVASRMPKIEEGRNSASVEVRDARLEDFTHHFEFKRRRGGGYAKQTLTGMKPFFHLHKLQAGDRIMIYLKEKQLQLFGQVIDYRVYSIDFEKGPVV